MIIMISFLSNVPMDRIDAAVDRIEEWLDSKFERPLIVNYPGVIVTLLDTDKGIIYTLNSNGENSVKKAV